MYSLIRSVRLAGVAVVVAVAMAFSSFSFGAAVAAPADSLAVADPVASPTAHRAEVARLQQEAVAYLTAVERIPDSVLQQGDAAVIAYVQNDPVLSAKASAQCCGGIFTVAKCVAAIVATVGSTVFAAAKIVKIKKLIRAAGGVKKTAQRIIKAAKTRGSLSTKAKAGFKDLGKGVVELAVVVLGIDTIINNCR